MTDIQAIEPERSIQQSAACPAEGSLCEHDRVGSGPWM
jgi:hypothetical protein